MTPHEERVAERLARIRATEAEFEPGGGGLAPSRPPVRTRPLRSAVVLLGIVPADATLIGTSVTLIRRAGWIPTLVAVLVIRETLRGATRYSKHTRTSVE